MIKNLCWGPIFLYFFGVLFGIYHEVKKHLLRKNSLFLLGFCDKKYENTKKMKPPPRKISGYASEIYREARLKQL